MTVAAAFIFTVIGLAAIAAAAAILRITWLAAIAAEAAIAVIATGGYRWLLRKWNAKQEATQPRAVIRCNWCDGINDEDLTPADCECTEPCVFAEKWCAAAYPALRGGVSQMTSVLIQADIPEERSS